MVCVCRVISCSMLCATNRAVYTTVFGAGRPETNPEDSLNESSSEDLETDGLVASAGAVDGVNIDK